MTRSELDKVLEHVKRFAEQMTFARKRRDRKRAKTILLGLTYALKLLGHEDEANEAIRHGIEERPLRKVLNTSQRIFPAKH